MSHEKSLDDKGKEDDSDRGFEKASLANAALTSSQAPTVECNLSNSSSSATSSLDSVSRMKESHQHPVAKQGTHHPPTRCYSYDLIYICPKQIEQVHPQPPLNSFNSSRSTLQHQSLKSISKASRKELSSSDSSSAMNTASTMKGSAQKSDELKGYDRIYRIHHYQAYSRPTLIPSNQKFLKPLSKVPPQSFDLQSNGFMKECSPMKKCPSFSNQCQEPLPQKNPMGYNQNDRLRDKFNRNGYFEACNETSRGPRSRGGGYVSLSSPAEKDPFGLTVQRDKYNLQTFQTEYEDAKCPSFSNQCQEPLPQKNPMGYNQNDRLQDKFNRNGYFEACNETSRGPRSRGGGYVSLSSPAEKDPFGLTVQRDKYNLQTFQTEYEDAKFFVIKSFTEEHIHKSIKYDVWSSTAYGNKKLNAAFHDADRKSSETGKRCPIFLFFSVNGSGQFVGLAEMLGQVDFEKDMDFWQQNKWNGFFPLKWQIIKDIPNNQLCHIILENNHNKPVTYTRDTQEIGFKQGLKMLSIFKSYTAKTWMLDDFNYYEDREKSKHVHSKAASPQMRTYGKDEFPNHLEAGVRKPETSIGTSRTSYPQTSLISLAGNLSLNPNTQKSSAGKSSQEG